MSAAEENFAIEFAAGGDAEKALNASGYDGIDRKRQIQRYLRSARIALTIQIEMRRRIVENAPMAMGVLESIAKDTSVSPKVRIDAAKTLLDRAGHIAPKAIDSAKDTTNTPLHEMTTDELRTMASKLEEEIAGRAKDVSSASVAPSKAIYVDLIG